MTLTLRMDFSGSRFEPPAMWATVWVRGERGTVVGFDADSYAEPMTRVLFEDGRVGMFKFSEMGAR